MQSNDITSFPYALSPLCLLPTSMKCPLSRQVSALDTLIRTAQALGTLYENSSDEDYGKALILETIHNAIRHAITLLSEDEIT